eukprot:4687814-Amphidinium_carterae.1
MRVQQRVPVRCNANSKASLSSYAAHNPGKMWTLWYKSQQDISMDGSEYTLITTLRQASLRLF